MLAILKYIQVESYNFDFSQEVIKKFSKFENIIIIGMGGSILGAKSIYSFFRHRVKKKIFFFDNLDSSLNLQYSKIRNLKNSCYIIISKSGNTLETIVNLNIILSIGGLGPQYLSKRSSTISTPGFHF